MLPVNAIVTHSFPLAEAPRAAFDIAHDRTVASKALAQASVSSSIIVRAGAGLDQASRQ